MPEAWVLLLRGITPRQINDGLNRLATRGSAFPPNGVEFRQICLNQRFDAQGNDISLIHKSAAHIAFNDPTHPSYEIYKPRLESDEIKSKRKEKAKSALSGLKGMFQMTTEEIVNRINQAGSRNELRVELDEIQSAIAKEKCDFDEQGWDSIKSAAESKKLELGIE